MPAGVVQLLKPVGAGVIGHEDWDVAKNNDAVSVRRKKEAGILDACALVRLFFFSGTLPWYGVSGIFCNRSSEHGTCRFCRKPLFASISRLRPSLKTRILTSFFPS